MFAHVGENGVDQGWLSDGKRHEEVGARVLPWVGWSEDLVPLGRGEERARHSVKLLSGGKKQRSLKVDEALKHEGKRGGTYVPRTLRNVCLFGFVNSSLAKF